MGLHDLFRDMCCSEPSYSRLIKDEIGDDSDNEGPLKQLPPRNDRAAITASSGSIGSRPSTTFLTSTVTSPSTLEGERCQCCRCSRHVASLRALLERLDNHQVDLLCMYLLMQGDQILDGGVLFNAITEGRHVEGGLFISFLLVPQLLTWFFLFGHDLTTAWALGRILTMPMLGGCLAAFFSYQTEPLFGCLSPDAVNFSICIMACISLEPLWDLVQGWRLNEKSSSLFWVAISEGLLEAPASACLTIFRMLLTPNAANLWLYISVVWSLVNMARIALQLHQFDQKGTPWYMNLIRCLPIEFPSVTSRVIGLALVAFCFSSAGSDIHRLSFVLFGIALCEIIINLCLLRTVSDKIPWSVLWIFSFMMVFTRPPGFFVSLDVARRPQLWVQHVLLLLYFLTSANTFASIQELQKMITHIWEHSRPIVAAWLIVMPVSFVASHVSFPTVKHGLRELLDLANHKLHEAAKDGDRILCRLLLDVEGAETSASNNWLFPDVLQTGRSGPYKWCAIAALNGNLCCAPCWSSDVLVVNVKERRVNFIKTGRPASWKWSDVEVLGDKFYCSPDDEADILVIDPVHEQVDFIDTGRNARNKWKGIAAFEGKLYCAPFNESDVMIIDPVTRKLEFIPTRAGLGKWMGIVAWNNKLYCAPYDSPDVLVIDPGTRTVDYIPTTRPREAKWEGIAPLGDKLYCAPACDNDVLVIRPNMTEKIDFIPTGRDGPWKWVGVAARGEKLYCAPNNDDDVLEIDPKNYSVDFLPSGVTGKKKLKKWRGLVAHEDKLYCCPGDDDNVLIDAGNVLDERNLLKNMGL